MPHPLVSIIIPCYNGEAFVADAIRSALAQTYQARELIVVDDGSSDRSLDVISSFGSAVRCDTGPNRGGAAARNRGLALARGAFVQFLDADDLLHPEKLEVQLRTALECHDHELPICWGAVEPDSNWRLAYQRRYTERDAVEFTLNGILPTPAPLHRRSLLSQVGGFRESLPCAQEFDLHLRLACSGVGFRQVPTVLYTVRQRANSVSSDHLRVLREMPGILGNAADALSRSNSLTEERALAMAGVLANGARVWLRAGQPTAADEFFCAARRLHPSGGISKAYAPASSRLLPLLGPRVVEKLSMLRRLPSDRHAHRSNRQGPALE